jgi:hypothetical protein
MSFFVRLVPRNPPHSGGHWLLIIGTLLASLLLGGCGTVRLAYSNAPSLAFWWIDGYFDFESEQASNVRAGLQRAHEWHRKEELPLLLAQLDKLQARALEPATAETLCQLASDVQSRYQAALQHMVPTIVAVVPSLREAQIRHLERELAKRRTDWQSDYLDGTAAERMERRLKKAVDRTESFYGKLRPEQVEILRTQLSNSTFDPAIQSRESLRRHQDTLTTLMLIRSGTIAADQVPGMITALVQRSYASPDVNYQKYQALLTQQGCSNFAALHNSMQPRQRARLAETLKSYAEDLRSQLPG